MGNKIKKANCSFEGIDGNAFILMAHWEVCARKSGLSNSLIEKVLDECMEKDYNNLLNTLQEYSEC